MHDTAEEDGAISHHTRNLSWPLLVTQPCRLCWSVALVHWPMQLMEASTSAYAGYRGTSESRGQHARYRSPMDLWQVCPTPSSSTTPSVPKSVSYFHYISNTPPFVPVPLVSPFVPMFPVSLISVSMSLWSSCLSHIVFSPRSCLSLFHTSTFHS